MGLYSGGRIIGSIFTSEIWGAYFREGFFGGGGGPWGGAYYRTSCTVSLKYHSKKDKRCLGIKRNGLVLLPKTKRIHNYTETIYLVFCCYGWQGWKWIETGLTTLANVVMYESVFKKSGQQIYYGFALPAKFQLKSSSKFSNRRIFCMHKGSK